MSLIAEHVVAVKQEYAVIFGSQVGGRTCNSVARLKRAQDMTARDNQTARGVYPEDFKKKVSSQDNPPRR